MPKEITFADFSRGMNASVAVDKLPKRECLLAENVRFDEAGNVLISGANTAQNTAAISDGTSSAVHSLFYSESIGAVAGVGKAVYAGANPTSLLQVSSTVNTHTAKMSFGAGERRVYMDIGGKPHFIDAGSTNLITIDWEPPVAAAAIVTGPKIAGLGTATGTFGTTWLNATNVTQTNTTAFATVDQGFSGGPGVSNHLVCSTFSMALSTTSAMQGIQVTVVAKSTRAGEDALAARLLINGAAVGQSKSMYIPSSSLSTMTYGGSTDPWDIDGLTPTLVNQNNFGVSFVVGFGPGADSIVSVNAVKVTAYQKTAGIVVTSSTAPAANGEALNTGPYTWKVTWVAANGEESDASSPTGTLSFTASGKAGTFTGLPLGDARTTGRNFYRKGGLLTAYYLVGSLSDNVSTTFGDGLSDLDALATAVILAGDVPGDQPNSRLGGDASVRYPTLHYQRFFWADKNTPNLLRWSKPGNHFAYPAVFEEPVGDGKAITGIVSFGGELFIFKTDSIWRLSGTDESSFQLSKTLSAVGTDWPFTIAALPDRIIFSNRNGIWAFNGYTSKKGFGEKLDLWFRQDDRSNVSVFGTNKFKPPEIVSTTTPLKYDAKASPSHYYLAYAESGQSAPNAMLVLDLERGSITKRNFPAQSLAIDVVSGYFYAGHTSGFVVKLDDWAAANNGISAGAVNFDFQTGFRDLGLRGSQMALWGVEFLIDTGGQNVTPTAYFDESSTSEGLTAISTTGLQRVFRKFASARSRQCRSVSLLLNASSTAVNSGGKPSIQLNHVKLYYDLREGRARTGEKQ